MPAKIPATVVTGFLGSGKTTLIRHMLQNAGGRRIALIINEFGDLGVDGSILSGWDDDTVAQDNIMELSNGCICCTVADDFVPTLQKLLDRETPPEHIVIETSGLALPQPLVRAFQWPDVRTRVTVDSVVTVVDGKAVSEGLFAQGENSTGSDTVADNSHLSDLFADQIACADLIVANKSDLLSDDEATALVSRLRNDSRAGVQVLETTMGAVPVNVLLGQGIGAENELSARHRGHNHEDVHDHDHNHDHGHDAFHSFVIERNELSEAGTFAKAVADLMRDHDNLRLKGFAAIEGKPMRMIVQAVGPRVETYFDRPFTPDEPRITRLVVIGRTGLDQAAIEKALST